MTDDPDDTLRAELASLAEHGRPTRRPDLDELDALVLSPERTRPRAGHRAWWAIAAMIVALGVSVGVVAETRPDPSTSGLVAPPETAEPTREPTTTTRPAEGDSDPADDPETVTPVGTSAAC